VEAREGAEDLFRSLERLADLPDETEIDPGHTGGSLCGAGLSRERTSTLKLEKLSNQALAIDDVHEFVAHSASIAAPRPPTVERVVALNRGPFLAAQPPLERVDSVRGQLLDVRPATDYAAGHAHGAVNVPLEGSSVGTKAGFVLDHETPITIHARSAEEAEEAARRLYGVGLLDVAGWMEELETPERIEPVGIEELEALLEQDAVEVVDVREKDERDEGYIPGTRHVPYRLLRAMGADVNGGKPIVTICSTGPRAAIAASVLTAAGVDARPILHGGVSNWPGQTVEFRRCGG
jgi:hydroxyacylglutathione hydrolase